MNHHFKQALLELYFDSSAYFYLKGKRIDYRKMIAFGAYGEAGENYYLFIYRDAFVNTITYGSILFLYEPYDLKQPIHVIHSDIETGWERRNIYTRAAAFFLKTNNQNTIALEHSIQELYEEQQELIRSHIQKKNEQEEQFGHFDFNLSEQEFKVEEIKPRPPLDSPSPMVKKN